LGNVIEFCDLSGHDLKESNTKAKGNVKPKPSTEAKVDGNKVNAVLKPLSWNVIRVSCQP
jgi:alpha-L-arabinofuranosidase